MLVVSSRGCQLQRVVVCLSSGPEETAQRQRGTRAVRQRALAPTARRSYQSESPKYCKFGDEDATSFDYNVQCAPSVNYVYAIPGIAIHSIYVIVRVIQQQSHICSSRQEAAECACLFCSLLK